MLKYLGFFPIFTIMIAEELEVKVQKVVKEPRISLTMISQYVVATENGKNRILLKCKYPSDYIPKFYEMARKLVCELFSGNFKEGHELYFEEFSRQASVWKKEAPSYPIKTDGYKNRIFSAKGLDGLVAMQFLLEPILQNYTLNSNLSRRTSAITKNGVKIGAVADMLLSDQLGEQVGFLKFNFSSVKLKKEEAEVKLEVLKTYFEKQGLHLQPKCSMLIDVAARRIYTLADVKSGEPALNQATIEIRDNWDHI
jgi:hypothetical protein